MKLFTYTEVKDIQTAWLNSHDRKRCIKQLTKKYECSEEEIQKVIDGDKNITTYSYIKPAKTHPFTTKLSTQDIRDITSQAVAEFEAESTDKPVAAISTATVDTLKKKGGWPKGKPRKKVATVIEEPYDLNVPVIYPHNTVLDNADALISQSQDAAVILNLDELTITRHILNSKLVDYDQKIKDLQARINDIQTQRAAVVEIINKLNNGLDTINRPNHR